MDCNSLQKSLAETKDPRHGLERLVKASRRRNRLLQENNDSVKRCSELLQRLNDSLERCVKLYEDYVGLMTCYAGKDDLIRAAGKYINAATKHEEVTDNYTKATDTHEKTTGDYIRATNDYIKAKNETSKLQHKPAQTPNDHQLTGLLKNKRTLEDEHEELIKETSIRTEEHRLLRVTLSALLDWFLLLRSGVTREENNPEQTLGYHEKKD